VKRNSSVNINSENVGNYIFCLNCYLESMTEHLGNKFDPKDFIKGNKQCYYRLTKEKILIEVL